MRNISRKEFLKVGAALPLAMSSLSLRAEDRKKPPPKRIIFICSCLGFYEPYFFPVYEEAQALDLAICVHQGQGAPGADGQAVDRGDDRLRELPPVKLVIDPVSIPGAPLV